MLVHYLKKASYKTMCTRIPFVFKNKLLLVCMKVHICLCIEKSLEGYVHTPHLPLFLPENGIRGRVKGFTQFGSLCGMV